MHESDLQSRRNREVDDPALTAERAGELFRWQLGVIQNRTDRPRVRHPPGL